MLPESHLRIKFIPLFGAFCKPLDRSFGVAVEDTIVAVAECKSRQISHTRIRNDNRSAKRNSSTSLSKIAYAERHCQRRRLHVSNVDKDFTLPMAFRQREDLLIAVL